MEWARMKECACKSLHYRFGQNWDTCEECGHPPMFHYAHFNRTVLNPIQRCVPASVVVWDVRSWAVHFMCGRRRESQGAFVP